MGEAEREKNAEHRRGRARARLDLVDAGRRAVSWRFTRGAHRDTLNAVGCRSERVSEDRGWRIANSEGAVAAAWEAMLMKRALRRPQGGYRSAVLPLRFP